MPFMKGLAPVRRTQAFLDAGKLIFRPEIRVMNINYNIDQKASAGVYNFLFWHLPQIRYKNPHLQLVKFQNMTPTPFIQLLFLDGEKELIDCYDRSWKDIHNHLFYTFCEPLGTRKKQESWNPAAFGFGCSRWCICEVPGQVPCPGFTVFPNEMRGKHKRQMEQEAREAAQQES